jgi:hypothetical protein
LYVTGKQIIAELNIFNILDKIVEYQTDLSHHQGRIEESRFAKYFTCIQPKVVEEGVRPEIYERLRTAFDWTLNSERSSKTNSRI